MVLHWRTDETHEAKVRAVVEQQYLSKVPVPIQHMAIFNHSMAEVEPDRIVLKFQGYVQANSAKPTTAEKMDSCS